MEVLPSPDPSGIGTPEVKDLLAEAMTEIQKNNKLFSDREIECIFNGAMVSPSLEEFFFYLVILATCKLNH